MLDFGNYIDEEFEPFVVYSDDIQSDDYQSALLNGRDVNHMNEDELYHYFVRKFRQMTLAKNFLD